MVVASAHNWLKLPGKFDWDTVGDDSAIQPLHAFDAAPLRMQNVRPRHPQFFGMTDCQVRELWMSGCKPTSSRWWNHVSALHQRVREAANAASHIQGTLAACAISSLRPLVR